MKIAQLIAGILLFAFTGTISQTDINTLNIYGQWTKSGSPYNIKNSVIIPADSTLTIEPGVVVNFDGRYKMLILGTILAEGTSSDSITFQPSNTVDGWYGFRFEDTPTQSDSSTFSYCAISGGVPGSSGNDRFGGSFLCLNYSKIRIDNSLLKDGDANWGGGALYLHNSSPLLKNNTFLNNVAIYGGAIYSKEGSPIIRNNLFQSNIAVSSPGGAAIYVLNGGTIVVEGNKFYDNKNNNDGTGGALFESCYPIITSNEFKRNEGKYGPGGLAVTYVDSAIVHDNIFSENYAKEGYAGGASISKNVSFKRNIVTNNIADLGGGGVSASAGCEIHNNLIANNSSERTSATSSGGGGMIIWATESTASSIANNTIVNNHCDGYGGGIFFKKDCKATLVNCIVYGNTSELAGNQVAFEDESTDPNFDHCNVEGGVSAFYINGTFYTGTFTNNIDTVPGFNLPSAGAGITYSGSNGNWNLADNSACVNSGLNSAMTDTFDLVKNQRKFGKVDIGAYENQIIVSTISALTSIRSDCFPNPSSGTFTISSSFPIEKVEVYDQSGRLLTISSNQATQNKLRIEKSGVYLVRVVTDSSVELHRAVVVR